MLRSLLFSLLLLLASGARGQTPGTCALGTAEGDLDVSSVFARVFNTGSLFLGNTTYGGYIVPRTANTSPFNGGVGLWLGGLVDGELRAAGARFHSFTFWPGPLNEDGTLPDTDDCSVFDRIYVLSVADVDRYEASGEASADLAEWPVGLGAPAVDASGQPLAVTSREQTLDLASGERPVIFGSQTAWWVMNDLGGPHTSLGVPPLGIEVRVTAYVISDETEAVGAPEATFYRYEIVNRSPNDIEAARAGFFSAPGFNTPGNFYRGSYVGTDTTRGMMFAYNQTDTDISYGTPPAVGLDVLSGAGASSYFRDPGNVDPPGIPRTGEEFYNLLQGLWKDGSPMRENDSGIRQPATFPITRYVFTGDPVTGQFWSEVNTDGMGRRSGFGSVTTTVSTPPFNLASGESHTVDLAILFAQGTDHLDSITRLRAVSDAVQAVYDDGSLPTLGGQLATLPAPSSLTPEAGQYLGAVDTVVFSWAPVGGAEGYVLKWGASPEALTSQRGTTLLADTVAVSQLIPLLAFGTPPPVGLQTVYWTVEALSNGATGMPSDVRAVDVFVGGPLLLTSGEPAYVEVARGDGGDPCGSDAVSPDGCDEVGGNLVYHSLNSDGSYYFGDAPGSAGNASNRTLGAFAPNDFEIRFTDEGGIAAYRFQWPINLVRVPFEIWDIGPVIPGEPNDPGDDVRLIPFLLADNGGICAFDAAEIPDGETTMEGFVESDRIYASYPASSYADFEDDFIADVDASPDGCVALRDYDALDAYVRTQRQYAIQRQVFGSPASAPALPGSGTIVRLYTTDAPPVAAAPPPEASGGIVLTVGPNPTRVSATVRLTLAAPEAVRVRVLDMLGREVAVLAEGPQASGEAVYRLPGDLASGVYAVEARAGEQRTTRLVTVVR